jgi:thiol-disulfide isomerase/thioredoxin
MRHFCLSLFLALAACPAPQPAATTATTTTTATATAVLPDLTLARLDGTAATLSSELGGRPALINLWATWCEACVAELGALAHLAERTEGSGVVLAIAVGEKRETVAEFVRRHGLGYARLVDEDFRLGDTLGKGRVPTTLVVDRAGRIVYAGGALDAAALDAYRRVLAPN